jgi:hypothetical protein
MVFPQMSVFKDFERKPVSLFCDSRVWCAMQANDSRSGHECKGSEIPIRIPITLHVDIALISTGTTIKSDCNLAFTEDTLALE